MKSRPPFEVSFVQNQLLQKLGGLNDRDRMVIMALADTGARISEIFGLKPEDIKLNDEIPFIWIRPREGYALKTSASERKIPLVGSAVRFMLLQNVQMVLIMLAIPTHSHILLIII